ncbi:hypothetical protein ACKWTF_006738 [Chironomus riparius]
MSTTSNKMELNSPLKRKTICEILRNGKITLTQQIELCYSTIERSYGKTLKEAKKASLKNKLCKLKSATKKKYKESHKNWSNTLRDHKEFFEREFGLADVYFED